MLLYVAVEPEDAAALEAGQPPVASLRKKHSIGKSSQVPTMPAAPRIAYSYQVTFAPLVTSAQAFLTLTVVPNPKLHPLIASVENAAKAKLM